MSSKRALLILVLLASILTFPWLGSKPFHTRGEPREAIVAQSMLLSGDYILPEGYGGKVPSKPPALHWLIAAASRVAGEVNEFTARFPSALSSLVFLIFFFFFVQSRKGREVALLSSLMLLSTLEWYRAATICRVDMVLSCLMAGGLLALYSWDEKKAAVFGFLSVFLFAGATLAKGPVAIVLPGGIFGLYLLLRGQSFRSALFKTASVFLPALLLASSWYWLAYSRGGDAFWDTVYNENIARFTGGMEDEPHNHSAPYLYLMFGAGMIPWSLMFIPYVPRAARAAWNAFRNIKAFLRSLDPLTLYCSITIAAFLIFFSLPSSKRGVYLLPAYPFVCALLGDFIWRQRQQLSGWISHTIKAVAGVVLAISMLLLLLSQFPIGAFGKSRDLVFIQGLLSNLTLSEVGLRGLFLIAPSLIAFSILFKSKRTVEQNLALLFSVLFAFILAVDSTLFPQFAKALSSREFSKHVDAILKPQESLYSFGTEFYSMSFELARRINRLEETEPESGVVFVYENDLEALKQKLQGKFQMTQVLRSSTPIVKPGRHVVAVRIM